MENSIDSKVLFIGIDYRHPKGGVASVEHEYSKVFSPFKFVRTCVSGGKAVKGLVAFEGLLKYIYKLLTDRKIKIIHVNAASDASFWRKRIFINIGKLFKKKIVYHNHGGGFRRFHSEHPRQVEHTIAKADCVIALSESWRAFFSNELGCRRVEVINNPVSPPIAVSSPTDSSANDLIVPPMRLLYLGAVTEKKGIYDLLEVLADNRAAYSGVIELLIGGNGEVDKLQRMIVDKHLKNIVKFQGWVDGEKKTRLLQQADVYILPSYYEGLPVSILEAMAYGKPVISTRVGGIPEIVKDNENGILAEPGDKGALKGAIDRMIESDEMRKSMGERGREMVKPYYIAEVAAALRTLYSSLLKS